MSYNLKNRSLLSLRDYKPAEIAFLLKLAADLKAAKYAGTEQPGLKGKEIALIFEKDSTRTRVGFEVAAHDQGATVTYLGPSGSHIGHKESVKDTARVLGRVYDAIEYRGFGQNIVEQLSEFSGVPVYNGLTDQFRSIAIVDEDRSALSRRVSDAIQPPYFQPPVEIDAASVDSVMDSGRYVFVIEIPAGFEADILAGRAPTVQVSIDATAMSQAGNGAVFLQDILSRELRRFVQDTDQGDLLPIDLVVRTRFNPNSESVWYSSTMQVINNITMLSVILCGAALIREREQGTIEQLLVMPVTPTDIVLSKILANGLVIVVAALLSFAVMVNWLMQVPIAGSIPLFILGAVIYQFSVNALGILLATFTNSMQQFGLLVLPILIAMSLLSGSKTPLESMPQWLQSIMQIAPSTHFVGFSQAVLYRAAGLGVVWPKLLAMAVIGAVFFALALLRFRRSVMNAQ